MEGSRRPRRFRLGPLIRRILSVGSIVDVDINPWGTDADSIVDILRISMLTGLHFVV